MAMLINYIDFFMVNAVMAAINVQNICPNISSDYQWSITFYRQGQKVLIQVFNVVEKSS